ncbi:hypothetical protein VK792_02090 [Mesobacterium sp. TK19101]|uniref:Uncharacterized protein n=1 Tax=Mesobacterium hydrothermale TaxID=3111907 RepID=A0ABU6HEI5_9RHOB|nr:hypothetical protein [Mesobacterium sp. TK19101]MEC3860064.1 hypothetical protein [Mesobacterium sp. TK19101]
MGVQSTDSIEATLYLATMPEYGANGAHMARLIQGLRSDAVLHRGKLHILRHIPGKYIEFQGAGLHGSAMLRAAQCPADLIEAQTSALDDSDAAHDLRAAVAGHGCYLHLSITSVVKGTATEAAKRILNSALGTLAKVTPVALYWGKTDALMPIDDATRFLRPDRHSTHQTQAVVGETAARLFRQATTARAQINATGLGHVAPQRVAARKATTPRPKPRLGKRLQDFAANLPQHLPTLPFGVSYGSAWRVAAGMVLGIMTSGWVEATFSADPAMATTTEIVTLQPDPLVP